MGLIFWGSVGAASDATMATVTNTPNSRFRDALDDLLAVVAADVIASDPTIIQAAEDALAQAILDANLVSFDDDAIPQAGRFEDNPLYVLREVDESGRLSRGVRKDGSQEFPTVRAGNALIGDGEVTSTPGATYAFGVMDSQRRLGELVLDLNGNVPQVVLDRWMVRMGIGSSTETTYRETHLIPIVGQSNSLSRGAPIAPDTNEPLPNLFTIPQAGLFVGTVQPGVEPLEAPTSDPEDGRGHGLYVARQYALQNPDVRVVALLLGEGGTGFRAGSRTWAPAREGQTGVFSLYRDAIDRTLSAASMFTGTVRTPLLVWHQGESDAKSGTPGTLYQTDLDELISGFRSEMPNALDAVFLVGQLLKEFRDTAGGTVVDINAVHVATPSRVPRTGFFEAPPAGYSIGDDTHFNGAGQWILGQNAWAKYADALYNL